MLGRVHKRTGMMHQHAVFLMMFDSADVNAVTQPYTIAKNATALYLTHA